MVTIALCASPSPHSLFANFICHILQQCMIQAIALYTLALCASRHVRIGVGHCSHTRCFGGYPVVCTVIIITITVLLFSVKHFVVIGIGFSLGWYFEVLVDIDVYAAPYAMTVAFCEIDKSAPSFSTKLPATMCGSLISLIFLAPSAEIVALCVCAHCLDVGQTDLMADVKVVESGGKEETPR